MRLLPKSEIVAKKAEAQRQTIDEGKKLAKQVDRLREVAADEEASLNKFRSETIQVINQEITESIAYRDQLQGQIQDMKLTLETAGIPIKEKEAALERKDMALSEVGDYMEKLTDSLTEREDALVKKETEFQEKETRINQLLDATGRKLESILDKERDAAAYLAAAADKDTQSNRTLQQIQTELTNREQDCINREQSLIIREKELSNEKDGLQKSWRLLEDRKAAFERTIKRFNT